MKYRRRLRSRVMESKALRTILHRRRRLERAGVYTDAPDVREGADAVALASAELPELFESGASHSE